jgi:hypothetical protein
LKTVPLVAVTPEKKEQPVTEAIQVLPLQKTEKATPAAVKELPKTASSIPMLGLLGISFIGLAFGLKLLAKQLS